ncbi:MAG: RNA methyltransferase [Acidobacteria bacterium]|nr:RNA methyltransferase [Acidobacteriota bacterium]
MKASKDLSPNRLRRIEGRHNALVKELRLAFSRRELSASGVCAIEGVRIIEEAIRSGLRLRAVFVSESGQQRAARLLPQVGLHVETLLVPDRLFAQAVATESPQGVAALVHMKTYRLESVLGGSSSGPMVALGGIQDPGNLGTILRSAEAFGVKGVLVGEGTVSPYNSKVVRASAGSIFRVPVAEAGLEASIREMRAHGLRLLATSSRKGTPLPDSDLSGGIAVFIGNEGAGLDKKLVSEMDELVMIPHSPRVESLNAGIAASIILYEAARQKLDHRERPEEGGSPHVPQTSPSPRPAAGRARWSDDEPV